MVEDGLTPTCRKDAANGGFGLNGAAASRNFIITQMLIETS
jgi:hypothetical protein